MNYAANTNRPYVYMFQPFVVVRGRGQEGLVGIEEGRPKHMDSNRVVGENHNNKLLKIITFSSSCLLYTTLTFSKACISALPTLSLDYHFLLCIMFINIIYGALIVAVSSTTQTFWIHLSFLVIKHRSRNHRKQKETAMSPWYLSSVTYHKKLNGFISVLFFPKTTMRK